MEPSYSPVTLGQQIRQFDAGVFALTEAVYPPGLALPRHVHGCPTISLVLNGFCTEVVGGLPHECKPYSLILKPPGEVHSNQYGRTGARVLLVEVKPSPERPCWLREARELINDHFRERISLFTVAASVAVDPAHLSRMFRKYYRCTVGDYVRRLRLDYASEELAHSSSSLAEIATSAGFYDQSHFTHAFKLHTGITPAAFRSSVRKK